MVNAREAVQASTFMQSDPPARFALVLRPGQNPDDVANAARILLSPMAVEVAALSILEPNVLVLKLPGRVFGDDAQAFEAAYALADELGLDVVEPDLSTDFYPDPNASRDGKDPLQEGLGGFPPGCWADAEPRLEGDPMWAPKLMKVPEAWAFSDEQNRPSRGEGITIAQPDTGVTEHGELIGRLAVPGRDVLDDHDDPTDPLENGFPFGNPGHGTGTASVVVSPQTLVVTGTAPKARHMAIRAISSVMRISQVSVAEAIDWATLHGAHVITMSLGGLPSFSLHRALRRAVDADVIVLAAAGNCVRLVVWPARYEDCIAVGGTNSQDGIWTGSCRGAAVDVSAPAQNVIRARIPSGQGQSDVGQGQGTSFAVAMTAGVAALWLAHHGRANLVAAARARGETLQAMFLRLVRKTARQPGEWDTFSMGAGVVNALALLKADFDLGLDNETLGPQPGSSTARTVRSLVAEAFDPMAASDEDLDWHRFGPEIAATILRRQAESAPALEAMTPQPTMSGRLANAITNPKLQTFFGLNGESDFEVGTVDG